MSHSSHHKTTGAVGAQSGTRATYAPVLPNAIIRRWPEAVPMTLDEVRKWVSDYNDWVTLWNTHETSRDLPLSPEWVSAHWEHALLFSDGLPASCLVFLTKPDDRVAAIRVAGWHPYHDGPSFCRHPVSLEKVVWAGWLKKRSPRRLVSYEDDLQPA